MKDLQAVEVRGQRVLTTRQIAEAYGTTKQIISYNFNYNKHRYTEGKHYITLQGDELRAFKASHEIHDNLKYAHIAYLWTEKGALLHAKSLNTDKAWQVYEYLVDFYFRAKEESPVEMKHEPVEKPICKKSDLPVMDNPIKIFKILLQIADDNGINVDSFPLETVDSVLHSKHIGIRNQMLLEKVNYEFAWELAHAFIHHDAGDMIKSPLSKEYNKQATRAAEMIIKMLNTKIQQS